jgi:microcystin-dependent protein
MDPFLGEIRLFSFPKIPMRWVACYGQLLQITQYQALYALVGTYYGGNGTTNFGIPDLRGRVPVSQGASPISTAEYFMGQQGGAEGVALVANQLPSHGHQIAVSNAAGTTANVSNTVYVAQVAVPPTPAGAPAAPNMFLPPGGNPATTTLLPGGIASVGAGAAHENRQPYLAMNYCIATQGLFPSRN